MNIRSMFLFLISLIVVITPAWSQEQQETNEIVTKMQHDLNLSDDQVSNISQIVDRYVIASADLQKSINDGTINESSIDSQKEQLKAAEEQGIAQYLRPDQLYQWQMIESQDAQSDKGSSDNDSGADEYSNLPRGNSPQN